ncbi:MAG: hypothetical protein U9P90_01520 [Patescibacteria group bacterium]|nr:hypothetical protein [Patescibacteria group bacterium]
MFVIDGAGWTQLNAQLGLYISWWMWLYEKEDEKEFDVIGRKKCLDIIKKKGRQDMNKEGPK